MRTTGTSDMLKAKAIAGTHVVILAWDLRPGQKSKLDGLLGFAIRRTEYNGSTKVEAYTMRSIKRFKDKDKGLPPGTPVPTDEHPLQTFQWGDYTARPDHKYEYQVVPMYGEPKLLEGDKANTVTIKVKTEPEISTPAAAASSGVRHDIFTNRGVIGSQHYAREFKNAVPDADDPDSPEMKWLSRGLFEALMSFIRLAEDHRFALRAALYEFHYQPVANAFASRVEAGADVKIVFDDESGYKVDNRLTIENAGLDAAGAAIPRTVSEGIRHNKFIILLKNNKPIAVWTGSTNISAGGIFGHSNVGHIVWDEIVASAYLQYWENLAKNLTPTKLRPLNQSISPLPSGKIPQNSVVPVFSARDAKDNSDTLQWYADRMNEAKKIICFTVAFNLDKVFQDVIAQDNDVLRYIVKDDDLGQGEILGQDRDVLFAAGGYLDKDWLANFLGERGNPLNTNDYIHTKFMLVDPLGNDPLVVTGSANFSHPSQRINDENMLVIRGDTRVADIYFGEFMRIFDHHYARYLVKKLRNSNESNSDAGYLKEKPEEWIRSHFIKDGYKEKRRKYFTS
jgi:phosphatidylserine/phosphatidylglycerophosphate/cardiolipin synthase-like enzyme